MLRCTAWAMTLILMTCAAMSHAAQGPIGRWDFDEPQGDRVSDSSGNGFHGRAIHVTRVKTGRGFAAQFRGYDSFVDCGEAVAEKLDRSVTLEAWVNPQSTPAGEVGIAGTGYGGFLMTHYNDGALWWYIASGTNQARAPLENKTWQHVAAVFDGDTLAVFINGREIARNKTKFPGPSKGQPFLIGRAVPHLAAKDPNYAKVGFFQGMVDAVRVYDRALTPQEAAQHFKDEAADYGYDTTWFKRVRTTLFHYPERNEAVVDLDYRGLMPLPEGARFTVELAPEGAPAQRATVTAAKGGTGEARLALPAAARPSVFRITVAASPEGVCPMETLAVTHPKPQEALPSPEARVAPPLPPAPAPAVFGVEVRPHGGFALTVGQERYNVTSRFSWPHGDFNVFAAPSSAKCEPVWKPVVRKAGETEYVVEAHGAHYAVSRRLTVKSDHVVVRDTVSNTSPADLGLFITHELDLRGKPFDRRFVSGSEGVGRRKEDPCPSAFAGRNDLGLGLLPVDDLFVIQAQIAVEPDRLSAGTEEFALAPGTSYTFEWAVYVNTSGDYYDFVNAFRRNESRIGTVDGGLAFITKGPFDRRNIPDADWMALRNIKYGVIHCLSGIADDPELSVEGIEFMDFPKEMALLKQQHAELRRRYPNHMFMFHVAHSLYLTNTPDRFKDSLVTGPDGKPAVWGDDGRYISKARQAQGWQWYIYYPAPGNSFHDALLRSVDVMMDEIGAQGGFMDGFFWGYVSRWTYNTWDGLSADLDPATKTIARKKASVLYLSQPSLIAYTRKIRDKGGVVVANNSVITRGIAGETYLLHDKEISAGPFLHLAPNATALTDCMNLTSERDVYRDMLAKLRWGMLFLYYQEGELTYPSLASKQFPITFEEMREGMVIGPERIVTMKSGVYGRPGSRSVPVVHHFDARGALSGRLFLTTVDASGARTDLPLDAEESAVLENVGLTLDAAAPVNAAILEYTPRRIRVALHGAGPVKLVLAPIATVAGGAMPITPGAEYRVTTAAGAQSLKAGDALEVPLLLSGAQEALIERP